MPIHDYDGAEYREIGKLYDKDGTADNPIGKVEDYDGTTYRLTYNAELIILDGTTSNAGSPSIAVTSSGDSHKTGLGSGGWYLTNNGAAVAALANKVDFTGYSKLYFTVAENNAFTDACIGYRTNTKTWLNASGVVSATRVDLSLKQTGTFYIDIPSSDTSGYILIQQTSQGVGIGPKTLKISKIWLE